MNILNIAAYRFVALSELAELRAAFKARGEELGLKGTILIAGEGINLVLAGAAANVEDFLAVLRADARFAPIEAKRSWSAAQPFRRLLVKVKREIVSMRRPEINPCELSAPRLAPQELKRWLDEGREIALLDTRNQFEVELGSFEHALTLGLKSFSEFPRATPALAQELKDRPVVTFCTGGIRCEKAAPWLIKQGFREVYQLDGGILNYFEQCGGAHFRGECFVFDERVALDAGLRQMSAAAGAACSLARDKCEPGSRSL
ncbi:MAG: sulfurtransferase [Burkholderiales bacterium]|nr:sulfurtransferase [Burkholderiales bacterium]